MPKNSLFRTYMQESRNKEAEGKKRMTLITKQVINDVNWKVMMAKNAQKLPFSNKHARQQKQRSCEGKKE